MTDLEAFARELCASLSGEVRCRAACAELDLPRPWHLFGAGKASLAMARGVMAACGPPDSGLLVTKGEAGELPIDTRRAGHPIPDERSRAAGAELVARLAGLTRGAVLFVLSGGASSLLGSPLPGTTLEELQRVTRSLLHGGAAIADINRVRRGLTVTSGGRLARACRLPVTVLVLSDVLGDELSSIGSGPFVTEPASAHVEHRVVGSHETMMAEAEARARGRWRARRLSSSGLPVEQVAARLLAELPNLAPGELLLSGGEPTVVLPPEPGAGGRNQHLALLIARGLAGGPPARFVALASDGDDGTSGAAGAVVDHHTWRRIAVTLDPEAALARCDSHAALAAAGAILHSGPTGTNVLDLHLLERSGPDRSPG